MNEPKMKQLRHNYESKHPLHSVSDAYTITEFVQISKYFF